tara:strand:- start:4222 stop:4560 length:339 start_codon:yes stop_codon:yes gene_type:complete
MVWKIPRVIVNGLKKDIDLFIKLTNNEITDRQDAMCCYIFGILSEKGGVSTMYKLLKAKNIDEKIAKEFLNYSLKMRYKMINGKWSWFEMDEFNIPFDEVKDCSTDYQLPNN